MCVCGGGEEGERGREGRGEKVGAMKCFVYCNDDVNNIYIIVAVVDNSNKEEEEE